MLLAERLPCDYGTARHDGGNRRLPAVVRWRNYYFDQDLIGRRLDPRVASASTNPSAFELNHSLGDGTHTDYFTNPRFARVLLS